MWRSWWRARISSIRIISPSASITRRSGCVPASTRLGSPSSTPANARAAVRLPTPRGPWKRNAWAWPSASDDSSSRFASSSSGTSANAVTDLRREPVDGQQAVDHDVPLGEARSELAIRVRDDRPERRVGSLDPVALVADARQRGLDVEVDEHGQVGKEPFDDAE